MPIPEKFKAAPPAAAMRLVASDPVQLSEKPDAAGKSMKVHIKARSKMSVDSFWFGKMTHDFSTMSMPPRLAIDDSHGNEIGYGRPYLTEWGVEIDATIIPNADNPTHEANRIIYNLSNDIPQQASIDFSGAFDIEVVSERQFAEVNGQKFEGPGVIFRNWSLRSCAICKEGVDPNTSSTLLSQGQTPAPRNVTEAKFVLSEPPIAAQLTQTPANTTETNSAAGAEGNQPATGLTNTGADTPEQPAPAPAPAPEHAEDSDKLALETKVKTLEQENNELKQKLSALPPAGAPPVSMSEPSKSKEELWKQYSTLSASDKTLFWREHRNEMKSK